MNNKSKLIVSIIVLAGILAGVITYVNADNQPTVDPITTLNNQINEIDKKLMVNSEFWNGFDAENKAMQKNIDNNKKLMKYHEGENAKLRAEKEKLIAEKEAKLLGK